MKNLIRKLIPNYAYGAKSAKWERDRSRESQSSVEILPTKKPASFRRLPISRLRDTVLWKKTFQIHVLFFLALGTYISTQRRLGHPKTDWKMDLLLRITWKWSKKAKLANSFNHSFQQILGLNAHILYGRVSKSLWNYKMYPHKKAHCIFEILNTTPLLEWLP